MRRVDGKEQVMLEYWNMRMASHTMDDDDQGHEEGGSTGQGITAT